MDGCYKTQNLIVQETPKNALDFDGSDQNARAGLSLCIHIQQAVSNTHSHAYIVKITIYNFSENWIPIFVKNSFMRLNIFSMHSQSPATAKFEWDMCVRVSVAVAAVPALPMSVCDWLTYTFAFSFTLIYFISGYIEWFLYWKINGKLKNTKIACGKLRLCAGGAIYIHYIFIFFIFFFGSFFFIPKEQRKRRIPKGSINVFWVYFAIH